MDLRELFADAESFGTVLLVAILSALATRVQRPSRLRAARKRLHDDLDLADKVTDPVQAEYLAGKVAESFAEYARLRDFKFSRETVVLGVLNFIVQIGFVAFIVFVMIPTLLNRSSETLVFIGGGVMLVFSLVMLWHAGAPVWRNVWSLYRDWKGQPTVPASPNSPK